MKINALNCPNCGSALKETGRFCEYECSSCKTISVISHEFNILPDNKQIEEKLNQLIKEMTTNKLSNAGSAPNKMGPEVEKLVLDKLLEQGENADPQTLYHIGCFYTSGKANIDRSARKAAEYYIKSANAGYMEAQYSIGYCYYHAIGVDKDNLLALKYFKMAAQQGSRESLMYVITILEKQLKKTICKRNEILEIKKKKERLLKLSQFDLENVSKDQIKQDIYHYLDLWANRDKNAYFELATQYFFGNDLLSPNQIRSFKMFEKSAELGKIEAQVMLGYFYEYGVPLLSTKKQVMPDIDRAIKIYESVNHPIAHYLLGSFYLFGYNTKPQDFEKAGKYFLMAAEKDEMLSTAALLSAYDREKILDENKVIQNFVKEYKRIFENKSWQEERKRKGKYPVLLEMTLLLMNGLGIDIPKEDRKNKEYYLYYSASTGRLKKPIYNFKEYAWWFNGLSNNENKLKEYYGKFFDYINVSLGDESTYEYGYSDDLLKLDSSGNSPNERYATCFICRGLFFCLEAAIKYFNWDYKPYVNFKK